MEKIQRHQEVEMNKKIFYINLKNKKYTECIETLRKEIIERLVLRVKEKDSYFSYSTTRDLYNVSKKYLEGKYIEISYKLYNFDIMDENEEYILTEMLEMYKELEEN